MNISMPASGTAPSSGGGGRQAQIAAQIKKLERKKQQLLKKLGAAGGGGGSAELAGGITMDSVNLAKASLKEHTSQAAQPAQDGQSGQAIPATPTAQPIQAPPKLTMPSKPKSADMDDMPMDPKEIMKMIALIESQIMMLKQQLDEEGGKILANSPNDDEDGLVPAQADLANGTLEAGSPEPVTVEGGSVDGYA